MSGGEGTFMVPSNYPDPHRQNVNTLPFGFAYGEGNDLTDLGHPTPPGALASTGHTDTTISLSWQDKAEDGGSYNLYNGATKLGSTRNATATISGLSASTAYTLSVSYVDDAGTESAKSGAVSVTTAASG